MFYHFCQSLCHMAFDSKTYFHKTLSGQNHHGVLFCALSQGTHTSPLAHFQCSHRFVLAPFCIAICSLQPIAVWFLQAIWPSEWLRPKMFLTLLIGKFLWKISQWSQPKMFLNLLIWECLWKIPAASACRRVRFGSSEHAYSWNLVYKVFHWIRFCGNKPIVQ